MKLEKCCRYIYDKSKGFWKGCQICGNDNPEPKYWRRKNIEVLDSSWSNIYGYSTMWNFKIENFKILLKCVIKNTSNEGDIILDFFLGSDATISVVHKLKRKWIGAEMEEHFYIVILPRMKTVLTYDNKGISKEVKEYQGGGFFKYHTLKQYKDALENIEFEEQDETQKKILYEIPDYFDKYMLEWATKDSNTFLNLEKIENPFNYKLKIMENYEQKIVNIDLIEIFNYLFGLKVNKYKIVENDERKYVFVFEEKDKKKVAIVWRSMVNIDLKKDKEIIKTILNEFNSEEIYANSDAIVEFKAIESFFKTLLFKFYEKTIGGEE